jgi:hypothetical protein
MPDFITTPVHLRREMVIKFITFFYFLALLICSQSVFAQAVLKGKVINGESGKPLPSVSVYLNNTSLGTITDEQGLFILQKIPPGKFRLVVSSIGFETYVKLVEPQVLSKDLVISLKPKSERLNSFEVLPFEPNGWEKWGKLFTDILIGTTPNSNEGHLKTTGYWAWWETMATMLPYDYSPDK